METEERGKQLNYFLSSTGKIKRVKSIYEAERIPRVMRRFCQRGYLSMEFPIIKKENVSRAGKMIACLFLDIS